MADSPAIDSPHKSSSAKDKDRDEEKEMAPATGLCPIHRSSSRPLLDVSRAAIQANSEDRNPIILLPNQSDDISHIALDIGGSLIKLVYFSRHEEQQSSASRRRMLKQRLGNSNGQRRSYPILGGRLHFVKFETTKLNECLDFLLSKLPRGGIDSPSWHSDNQFDDNIVIKLAMVKNQRIAEKLIKGNIYDCICRFEPSCTQPW